VASSQTCCTVTMTDANHKRRLHLVTTDDDGAMCVMHDVIADTAHDGTTDRAETASSHHYHCALLLGCDVCNHFTGLPTEHRFYLTCQLQPVQQFTSLPRLKQRLHSYHTHTTTTFQIYLSQTWHPLHVITNVNKDKYIPITSDACLLELSIPHSRFTSVRHGTQCMYRAK